MICPSGHVTWQPLIDPDSKILWRQAGQTGAVGLEIGVAVAIGYFGGQYLDGKFNTGPWLTWLGFGAGIGASIKALVRVTRQYNSDQDKDKPNEPPTDLPH